MATAPVGREPSGLGRATVAGAVSVAGTPLGRGPVAAVRAGIGLVPESRKTEGLALDRSVEDNVVVAAMRRLLHEAGAVAFLEKPVRSDALLAAVRTALSSA